jgi:hypothetical protein
MTLNKNGRVTADSAIFRLELLFYLKAFFSSIEPSPGLCAESPEPAIFT